MAGMQAAGPDYARCFGHYRQMSVQYALANCLACPKMKACVRVTWGWDQPRRLRRGAWDGNRSDQQRDRSYRSGRPEILAT